LRYLDKEREDPNFDLLKKEGMSILDKVLVKEDRK
jgi:hypothetical protein